MDSPSDRAEQQPPRIRPETAAIAIGLVVVALFLYWASHDAGSSEIDWLPGALLLAGLVVSVLLGARGLPRKLARVEVVALASLAGLTGWAFASIAWAGVRGDAWSGANRAFLYLTAFSLFIVLPWRARSATVILTAYTIGTAVIALLAVRHAASGSDRFIDGRLSFPTGYPNANAALFLSAFWVALMLATRRSTPTPVRVASGAAAAFLPQAAMLSQSRGSGVAFVVTALALLILLPGRVRTAAGVLAAVSIVALTWDTHLAVFDEAFAESAGLDDALRRSGVLMAVTAAAAALAVLAWAALDARLELSPRATRRLELAAAVTGVIVALAAAAAVAASDPVERADQAWRNFTAVDATDGSRSHFSLGVGSNRHDFWRVALTRFRERPVAGIGADNFAVDYVRERRSVEEPAYPHSLWVMVLSQLGVVGAALLVSFLVSAGIAAVPRRGGDPAAIAAGGAALAGSVYFFAHASVDWFWEIPALGAPALALLGLAASLRSSAGPERESALRFPGSALAAIGVVAGLGALSCLFPWLSNRQVEQALAAWRTDPAAAYDHLDAARALNPLSAKPDLVAGAIAARLDDRPRMVALFARSLERNPESWYAQLELGLAESLQGQRAVAVRAVRRAAALNPREPVLQDVLRRLEAGERIHPSSLDGVFVDRISQRTR